MEFVGSLTQNSYCTSRVQQDPTSEDLTWDSLLTVDNPERYRTSSTEGNQDSVTSSFGSPRNNDFSTIVTTELKMLNKGIHQLNDEMIHMRKEINHLKIGLVRQFLATIYHEASNLFSDNMFAFRYRSRSTKTNLTEKFLIKKIVF